MKKEEVKEMIGILQSVCYTAEASGVSTGSIVQALSFLCGKYIAIQPNPDAALVLWDSSMKGSIKIHLDELKKKNPGG